MLHVDTMRVVARGVMAHSCSIPPVSPMKKRTRPQSADHTKEELHRRYAAAFGCDWDLAPNGKRWSEVLDAAREADRAYASARDLLRELQAVLHRVAALSQQRGIEPGAGLASRPVADLLRGVTSPEYALTGVALLPGFPAMSALVDELLRQVEAKSVAQLPDVAADAARRVMGGGLRRALEDPASLRSFQREFADAMLSASRRHRDVVLPDGGVAVAPGLSGPPPRTTEGAEWRRAHLVAVLDVYPLRRSNTEPTSFSPPTDADIAVVSLLAGGLEEVAGRPRKTLSEVLKAERKAIALVRRRRGPLSHAFDEEELGSIHTVSTTDADASTAPRIIAALDRVVPGADRVVAEVVANDRARRAKRR